MESTHDVIVIGGGPAGSTLSTLLAREGHDVLLLEKEKFPRFHIGESITAFGFQVFKKLGVYEKLKQINYVKKKGLEFVMRDKNLEMFFYTEEPNEPDELPWAFQMARADLDQVMLDNARENGVDVREEHLVKRVLFDGDRAYGVEYKDHSQGASDELHRAEARWIVDASGQAAIINRQLRDNWSDDPLLEKKYAVYSHWKGDFEITNTDRDLNFKLCVHDNQRDWAWFLPIDRDVVSLGVVLSQETLREQSKDLSMEEIFDRFAEKTPYIDTFMKEHRLERVEKFRCARDYSYRSRRFYGDGWALTGDSGGFIDPVFSTGLLIACNSAVDLAESLNEVLARPADAPRDLAPLEAYQKHVERHFRINSMLVYLFYLCELDHQKLGNLGYLWKNIEWAGWWYKLRFLRHIPRIVTKPQPTLRKWGEQLLFGNPDPDNVFADIFMVLAENYDTLHEKRARRRPAEEPEEQAA